MATLHNYFLLLTLLLLSIGTSIALTSQEKREQERERERIREAYESCPTGNAFDYETGTCLICDDVIQEGDETRNPYVQQQPDDDLCYTETKCIMDRNTENFYCMCEYPLALLSNNNASCGYCRDDSDCIAPERCVKLDYTGNICAFTCNTDYDCEFNMGMYRNMICKEPFFTTSARNKDVPKICGCDTANDLIRGFGCVEKQNLTTEPLTCYECSGAEDCARAPFTRGVECSQNEACYIHAVIKNWTPRSYDEYDYIYFNADDHYEISRGCTPVTASSEQTRTSIVNSNKTLWQNCRLVNENPEGDESEAYIECFSTCIYRYCNWEGIDPIVYFEGGEDDEAIFAIIFGTLFGLAVFAFLLWSLFEHDKAVEKSREKLVESQADYGATKETPPPPPPEPEPEPEPTPPPPEPVPVRGHNHLVTHFFVPTLISGGKDAEVDLDL